MEELRNFIDGILYSLDDNNLFDLYRTYCERNNYSDEYIYYMAEFDEMFSNKTPIEIAELVYDNSSDFNPYDEYFKEDMYGLKSSDSVIELIEVSDMIDWLEDNTDELRDYLSYDEEEELDKLLGISDDDDDEEEEDEEEE